VIDLHTHILPEMDDGAENMEESILMAKEAYENGIRTIVATPHHMNGIYENERMDILPRVNELNHRLQHEGLNIIGSSPFSVGE